MPAHCRIGRVRMKAGGADLRIIHPRVNQEAASMASELMTRIQSGDVTDIGLITVSRGGYVGTAFSTQERYHSLNSGVATLAARLAMAEPV